jgi:hypothetical protein
MLKTKDRRFVTTKQFLASVSPVGKLKYQRVLTENCSVGFYGLPDIDKTFRCNKNTLVFCHNGVESQFRYVLPNILFGNTSFVVVDAQGELLYVTRQYLEDAGYRVIVCDFMLEPCLRPNIEALTVACEELTAVFFLVSDFEATPYLCDVFFVAFQRLL